MASVPQETAGGPPRHGTVAGYWRHEKAGERPCLPCASAHAQYNEDRRLAPQRRAVLEEAISHRRTKRPS
jgi:hypothetical protein